MKVVVRTRSLPGLLMALVIVLLTVTAPRAQATTGVSAIAEALRRSPVYVDPAASAQLSAGDADALASRLASIREGGHSRKIRFVLGYLAPAYEGAEKRALKAWLEHVAGCQAFALEEEAEAFRTAAAAGLAELRPSLERGRTRSKAAR